MNKTVVSAFLFDMELMRNCISN